MLFFILGKLFSFASVPHVAPLFLLPMILVGFFFNFVLLAFKKIICGSWKDGSVSKSDFSVRSKT